jgi:hypothetical protein
MLSKGRGDRFLPSNIQLTLPFEDQEQITFLVSSKKEIAYERVKKKHLGRNALPENPW